MKRKTFVEILIALFILLFVYTASAKLFSFQENIMAMHNQPLARWLSDILIYAIPITELIVVALLCINRTKRIGILLFTTMMIMFTGYVALVLSNHYGRIPCSCGGLMKELKWQSHLYINIVFTSLGVLALYLTRTKLETDNHSLSSTAIS